MKKILCICLIITILLNFNVFSYAEVKHKLNEKDKIVSALCDVESIKTNIGLANVDFDKFTFSNSINCYNYSEDGFAFSREFIPLLIDGELTAFAIKIDFENFETKYHITTQLVSELKKYVTTDTDYAIIYDEDSCNIYDGQKTIKLFDISKSSIESNQRINLRNDISTMSQLNQIELTNMKNTYSLDYEGESERSSSFVSCNVGYVPQGSYDKLCWAASIASIANYYNYTSLSAANVSTDYFGYFSNESVYYTYIGGILSNQYNINYSYLLSYTNITPYRLYNNISAGYPIYASFSLGSFRHGTVIYGIDPSSTFFTLMDPSGNNGGFNYGYYYNVGEQIGSGITCETHGFYYSPITNNYYHLENIWVKL